MILNGMIYQTLTNTRITLCSSDIKYYGTESDTLGIFYLHRLCLIPISALQSNHMSRMKLLIHSSNAIFRYSQITFTHHLQTQTFFEYWRVCGLNIMISPRTHAMTTCFCEVHWYHSKGLHWINRGSSSKVRPFIWISCNWRIFQ